MTYATALAHTRLHLADVETPFQVSAVGDGTTTRFELPVRNATSVIVSINGTIQTEGTAYSLDAVNGILTMATAPTATVVVQGLGAAYFDGATMQLLLDNALAQHNVGRAALTYATVSAAEEYTLTLLAAIEGLWILATAAAFDINISSPEGVMIPRSQRFQQIMALIGEKDRAYRELSAALNVGPYRIQMYNLRRISRTTGRLVPIYVSQEFDDRNPPVRVYPAIDAGI